MSISSVDSSPVLTAAVSLPPAKEAVERVADNEAVEASQSSSLKEGTGTKIDITA